VKIHYKILTAILAIIFLFGFVLPVNPPNGNWYQQFMPNIGGERINDIIFLDSLTGFAVASRNVNPDSASILKTTNGGDNWQIVFTQTPKRFNRVQFINSTTGFVCGGSGGGTPQLYKTTDAGQNWSIISSFGCSLWKDMFVLDENTIWLVDDDSFCGGVFYTTNGGVNWTVQYSAGTANPDHIYMYNARIGFISYGGGASLGRTTNGGQNWTNVSGADGYSDIHFIDSITGWKCLGSMKKTSDGGLTWVLQTLPSGGIIFSNSAVKMSFIGRDIIWAVGGEISFPNSQIRGILFRTTNSGQNWLFQIPDTSIHLLYGSVQFINSKTGWAYGIGQFNPTGGIHTTNGGDSNWLTGLYDIGGNISKDYDLYQNYPNPFNPKTIISYQLRVNSNVHLIIYNMQGKKVITLVNRQQNAGTYQIDFSGNNLSSGVYFYSLYIDNILKDTKKMVLIK
jgi:photosystem II stability/assembly factor-like uncharacterized protein